MLRNVRRIIALLVFVIITLLFLDYTGTIHKYFAWMASIQLVPAFLALNFGIVISLVLLTLIFGRVYCSVICPLGILQDIISFISSKRKGKKHRFTYSNEKKWLRYSVLAIFIIIMALGSGAIGAILAPYSAYGRIVSSIFAPIFGIINNLLAEITAKYDIYSVYAVDVYIKSFITLSVAIITLIVIFILAWRGGRTYCNTICPVGSLLGLLSKYSYFKPFIDTSLCVNCGLCSRSCKSSCINVKNHSIDYSRCVMCMNCFENCKKDAIKYCHPLKKNKFIDKSRRKFMAISGITMTTVAIKAEEKITDGGLAIIQDKKIPNRIVPIVPVGAISLNDFTNHCTACQLCVSACPNNVLRPSQSIEKFMQPEMSYELGFCRPECTMCAEICPTDAIHPLPKEEKMMRKIGTAHWVKDNCIILRDNVECGNCARHCPNGAIRMEPINPDLKDSPKFPVINTERCIGCGACEYVCPARPFSAIYIDGLEVHRTI